MTFRFPQPGQLHATARLKSIDHARKQLPCVVEVLV